MIGVAFEPFIPLAPPALALRVVATISRGALSGRNMKRWGTHLMKGCRDVGHRCRISHRKYGAPIAAAIKPAGIW